MAHLDDFEINVMGFAPSHAIEYAGSLDSHALAQAFELLCHRYPVLRPALPSYPMTVLFPTYSAYTYEDRLSIRIVYPTDLFDDSSVEHLVGVPPSNSNGWQRSRRRHDCRERVVEPTRLPTR
jgi:hypothetical protein